MTERIGPGLAAREGDASPWSFFDKYVRCVCSLESNPTAAGRGEKMKFSLSAAVFEV
jgi:hypothetical protein